MIQFGVLNGWNTRKSVMENVSSDIVSMIRSLLPGFLAAAVFYSLTAHPKRDTFDRVVQALIFTVIVQALLVFVRIIWWLKFHKPGEYWTDEMNLLSSLAIAILFGVIFAALINWDVIHSLLRIVKITRRTSHPSEWYSAFCGRRRYVVLNLSGNRRLYGWPREFPDQSDHGHFIIEEPAWVLENGEHIPLHKLKSMVIPATDVEMIELEKFQKEMTVSRDQMVKDQQPLVILHKEQTDGIASTATATQKQQQSETNNGGKESTLPSPASADGERETSVIPGTTSEKMSSMLSHNEVTQ